MSARLYTTVYDPDDLPTEEAHIEAKRGELERSLRDLEGRANQILHQVACSH